MMLAAERVHLVFPARERWYQWLRQKADGAVGRGLGGAPKYALKWRKLG